MNKTFLNKTSNISNGRLGRYLQDLNTVRLLQASLTESDMSSTLGRIDDLELYIDNVKELHDKLEDVRREAFQMYKLGRYNSVKVTEMFRRAVDFGAEFYSNASSEKIFTSNVRNELSKKYEKTFRARLEDTKYAEAGTNDDLDHLTGGNDEINI